VPINAIQSNLKGEYVIVIKADGSTENVSVTSGDLVESLVTITTTGSLAAGDKVQLGTSSSSPNNSGGGGIGPGGGVRIGG
jgi:hypothetical protein